MTNMDDIPLGFEESVEESRESVGESGESVGESNLEVFAPEVDTALEEKTSKKTTSKKKRKSKEVDVVQEVQELKEVNEVQEEENVTVEKPKVKPSAKKLAEGGMELKLPYTKPQISRNARGQELPHFAVKDCIMNGRKMFKTTPEVVSIALKDGGYGEDDLITMKKATWLVLKFLKREVK